MQTTAYAGYVIAPKAKPKQTERKARAKNTTPLSKYTQSLTHVPPLRFSNGSQRTSEENGESGGDDGAPLLPKVQRTRDARANIATVLCAVHTLFLCAVSPPPPP